MKESHELRAARIADVHIHNDIRAALYSREQITKQMTTREGMSQLKVIATLSLNLPGEGYFRGGVAVVTRE